MPFDYNPFKGDAALIAERAIARMKFVQQVQALLVLDDLGDGAHRAFLDAVAASDAGILVDNLGHAVHYLEHVLRACVNADSATDALVSFNDWM